MNIAKQSKNSSLQRLPKRRFRFGLKSFVIDFLPTVLLGCIIGTYLDLYFVGTNTYSFPARPFPNIFTINLIFTLVGLPVQLFLFLTISKEVGWLGKISLVLLFSLLAAIIEMVAEVQGFFVHTDSFRHYFTLIGYTGFLMILLTFYSITTKK